MINKIIHFITLQLIKYCEANGKVFFIRGKDQADTVYLIRYLLVNTKYFNFYIHRFLRSDGDDPHDHPWNFMTYVVDGYYNEHKYNLSGIDPIDGTFDYSHVVNHRNKGSLVFRKATDVHKVVVTEDIPVLEKERAPLTICITGPRKREWGFWKGREVIFGIGRYLANAKFVIWTQYLGIEDDSSKRG